MSVETTAIITESIAAARDNDSLPPPMEGENDTPPESTPEETPVVVEDKAVTPEVKLETPGDDRDDLDKELEGMGISRKAGERENRLPYSRIKKIFANHKTKLTDEHGKALTEATGKLTAAEQRLADLQKADELSRTDPDKFVSVLAALDPRYKKYVDRVGVETAVAEVKAGVQTPEITDPKPGPDAQDGSGYTQDGLDKLLAWQGRQTARDVEARIAADMEKRYGPLEKEYRASKQLGETITALKAQIGWAVKTWGQELFNAHEKQIQETMAANPQMRFEVAAASVLTPAFQAQATLDENALREKWLKELQERPAAASSTAPASTVVTDPAKGDSTIDAIRASIKNLKR